MGKKKKENVRVEDMTPQERMEFEAANLSIEETLGKYLQHVFREEHFVVGLDLTGCYLFAENGSDEEIAVWVKELKDDLCLKKSEVCLCVIGRESNYNYCSKKLLGKYLGKATKSRKAVFTNRDIEEILDAYNVGTESPFFYADYSGTRLFGEIQNILDECGWDLDKSIINRICYLRPYNFQALKDLGIPEAAFADILECIHRSGLESPEELIHRKAYKVSDENIILQPKKGRRLAFRFLMFIIMAALIIVLCKIVWNSGVIQDVLLENVVAVLSDSAFSVV